MTRKPVLALILCLGLALSGMANTGCSHREVSPVGHWVTAKQPEYGMVLDSDGQGRNLYRGTCRDLKWRLDGNHFTMTYLSTTTSAHDHVYEFSGGPDRTISLSSEVESSNGIYQEKGVHKETYRRMTPAEEKTFDDMAAHATKL